MRNPGRLIAGLLMSVFLICPARSLQAEELTVYSGRSKSLVENLFNRFEKETGIKLKVRYGDTAELAATILEEGSRTPADVFFAQDAGALGVLAAEKRLVHLPEPLLERVDASFRSSRGSWVGVSGRARVLAYSTERVKPEELPASVAELTDPRWKGRVGWPPSNGSFQAFVTAMRVLHGEEKTSEWLKAMLANNPKDYPRNAPAVQAIAAGEIDVALVNHYYLYGLIKSEGEKFPVRNHYFADGDVGSLVNVAGAGILDSSKHADNALKFIDFLLSVEAQNYFARETYEYPLLSNIESPEGLPPLKEIQHPEIDLEKLEDLRGTLDLLRKTRVLP